MDASFPTAGDDVLPAPSAINSMPGSRSRSRSMSSRTPSPILCVSPTPSAEAEAGILPHAPSVADVERVGVELGTPHPAIELISAQLAPDRHPEWLMQLEPVQQDRLGRLVGAGRQYRAQVLAPSGSPYDQGFPYVFELFLESSFPYSRPRATTTPTTSRYYNSNTASYLSAVSGDGAAASSSGEGGDATNTLETVPLPTSVQSSLEATAPPPIRVRLAQVIRHAEVPEHGVIPDAFVYLAAPSSSSDGDTTTAPTATAASVGIWNVLAVLDTCRLALFTYPSDSTLAHRQQQESLPERNELLDWWATHDADCPCLPGKCLPMTFEAYTARNAAEQRAAEEEFYSRFRQLPRAMWVQMAEAAASRSRVIASWQGMSTMPNILTGAWHPELWLRPELRAALVADDAACRALFRIESPGVVSFPLFTEAFCEHLCRELNAFEASTLPKTRPNSMNAYGLVLNDVGFERFCDHLLAKVVQPLARLILPDASAGHALDHHHTFVVSYERGKDKALDMHVDDSEVTLNVNLHDAFKGSGLVFCGLFGTMGRRKHNFTYKHERGRAILHAGLHTHGALPLVEGVRHNLILWARSSSFRTSEAFHTRFRSPTLNEFPPDRVCLSRTHDRDYDQWAAAG
eukprot:UC1_evm10s708